MNYDVTKNRLKERSDRVGTREKCLYGFLFGETRNRRT
jgi:hypothetical protein